MTRIPIRIRVAAAFAVSMAIVLAGTSLFLYTRLGADLNRALDHDLRLRAQDLAALARDSRASIVGAGAGGFVETGESYAELLDGQGRVLQATRPLGRQAVLTREDVERAQAGTIFADLDSVPGLDEPSRALATPVERGGRRLVLVVGTTRQDRAETLSSFRNELLIAGPIALVLATLAGYLLAGLSLRSVERMRRRAAEITGETPAERLPVPETRDEVQRLGETLNAMLGRLEEALERERGFVADAGHELRTPLTHLRTELELALRHAESAGDLRAAVHASSEEVERLAQLAEDLLLIAGSDRGRLRLNSETLDVTQLLETVARRFEWRAEESGRDVHVSAPARLLVEGDRLRLEQALGNLVDNALRHGAGRVRLSAASVDGLVELHVGDEGAGFPPAFLPDAFERFTRPDEGRTGGGAGLGLSIVRAIAEAHGGTAQAMNAQPLGADVWLSLPGSAGA